MSENKSHTTFATYDNGYLPNVQSERTCYKCGKKVNPKNENVLFFGSIQFSTDTPDWMRMKYAPYCTDCSKMIAEVASCVMNDDKGNLIYDPKN